MKKENEVWKDIVGYEGHYQISNFLRIRNLKFKKIRILHPYKGKIDYYNINLYINGKRKTKLFHKIIAEAFIPNPENKKTVNHKNGIRSDDRIKNLEWNTHKENTNHSINILGHLRDGENNGNSKLTKKKIIEIRKKYATGKYSMQQLANEYNVTKTNISRIIRRKLWNNIK